MKIKTLYFAFLITLSLVRGYSQESRLQYAGAEWGMNFLVSEISNTEYIRGNIPSYSAGYTQNYLRSLSLRLNMAAKYEIVAVNDRLSFSTGLRYSRMSNSIGRNEYGTINPNYFYVLYRSQGTETEFVRVREIRQNSDYLGVPFDVHFLMGRRPHVIQLFLGAGGEANMLISTRTRVVFLDSNMETYQGDIAGMVDKPGLFYASFHLDGGVRIGYDSKPNVTLAGCFPYFVLNPGSGGMLHPVYGGGFELNVRIPLNLK